MTKICDVNEKSSQQDNTIIATYHWTVLLHNMVQTHYFKSNFSEIYFFLLKQFLTAFDLLNGKKIKEICFSGVLIAEECLDATKYKTEYNSILVLFIFKENEISFAA